MTHPISTTYLDQQQARVSAVLPAAGAWDTAPIEMPCAGFTHVTLYFSYTEGEQAATGALGWKYETAPDYDGSVWHQSAIYASGAVASGSDTTSNEQREDKEYGATGATIERWSEGPIALEAGAELIRVFCRENGVVGTPGIAEVEARFS
jgi:hypothetical protein